MKNAWQKWMVVAKKFGNIQANILLSLIYLLIILPLWLVFKLSGKFNHMPGGGSYWLLRKKVKQDISWARKQ